MYVTNAHLIYQCKTKGTQDNLKCKILILMNLDWNKEYESIYIVYRLTRLMMAIASVDKKRGYLTSSLTMQSNTSSSSSPGKGDYINETRKDKKNQ